MTPEEIAANSGVIQRLLGMFGATRGAALAWERERQETARPEPARDEVMPGVTREELANLLMTTPESGPPTLTGREAPAGTELARRVMEGSPVDFGERMLTPGGPPPAPLPPPRRAVSFGPPELLPSESSVFGRDELTPETLAALYRERDAALSETARAGAHAVIPPAGQIPAAITRGIAATGRHIARNPAPYGATIAGLTTLGATAETQEQPPANDLETVRKRLTELQTEDRGLQDSAKLFDNLVDPKGIRDQRERERAAERVRAAQAALNINQDGALGPETRAAIAAERKRIADERARVARERGTTEGLRDSLVADERARETRAGPWHQATRELGPWVAAGLGAYLGHRTRTGAVGRANELTARNVDEANALLTPGPLMPGRSAAARADTMARAGRMNEFWGRGGAGEAVPFAPAQTERGFRRRSGAAEAATLFPPDLRRLRGQDWGHIGAGLGEAGLSAGGWYLAQQELAAAQAAVDRERSEINLERLERAQDMVAIAQAFMRGGLGYAGGRLGGAFTHPYSNARPNISGAEGEVMILNQLLARAKRRRR